jgi:hypothetical protein
VWPPSGMPPLAAPPRRGGGIRFAKGQGGSWDNRPTVPISLYRRRASHDATVRADHPADWSPDRGARAPGHGESRRGRHTVTAVDTKTDMATLTTDEGEVFDLPKEDLWKVGSMVECERVEAAPRPRLQNCQPWD